MPGTQFPSQIDTSDNLLYLTDRTSTYLFGNISSTDTVINVEDGSRFYTGYQIITIDDEQILCSSRTGNAFVVAIRGFNGTTAAQHQNGTDVRCNWTAYHHNNVINAIIALQESIIGSDQPLTVVSHTTATIKTVPLGFRSITYWVYVRDDIDDMTVVFDLILLQKNLTTVNFSIGNITGDNIKWNVSVSVLNSQVVVDFDNNEANSLSVVVKQKSIFI